MEVNAISEDGSPNVTGILCVSSWSVVCFLLGQIKQNKAPAAFTASSAESVFSDVKLTLLVKQWSS